MSASPEQLLAMLAELIRTEPRFDGESKPERERWLGQTNAVLEASGSISAVIDFRVARSNIGGLLFNRLKLMTPLQDAYAYLELKVPAASQGAFIPPGEMFKGYAAIVSIVKSAEIDLLIVDPYSDATLFTEIAPMIPDGVTLRCLTSKQNFRELSAASGKWISTGEQRARPVEVKTAPKRTLHDRYIIVDGLSVWHISQSIRDLAARSSAAVTQDRTDLAEQKIEFWEESWKIGEALSLE
jgi:hypothetical protein